MARPPAAGGGGKAGKGAAAPLEFFDEGSPFTGEEAKKSETSDDTMRAAVGAMMGDMASPEFQAVLDATLRQMTAGAGDATIGGADAADPVADGTLASSVFTALATETGVAGAHSIAKTLEMLNKLSEEADNTGAGRFPGDATSSDSALAAEGLSDELIGRMMSEFEGMGQKEDFSSVVDGMMRQLLSKDIMYVPMRDIAERFPDWLADRADGMSREQYENYGKMYQAFQKLVFTYETEPDNFPRIMELMQDLQECGNPPTEIIRELAPGLEVTPDGMPLMPNMGPGMPAVPGMPAASAACSIM